MGTEMEDPDQESIKFTQKRIEEEKRKMQVEQTAESTSKDFKNSELSIDVDYSGLKWRIDDGLINIRYFDFKHIDSIFLRLLGSILANKSKIGAFTQIYYIISNMKNNSLICLNNQYEINLSQKLGQGSSASVFMGRDLKTGTPVAAKVIDTSVLTN